MNKKSSKLLIVLMIMCVILSLATLTIVSYDKFFKNIDQKAEWVDVNDVSNLINSGKKIVFRNGYPEGYSEELTKQVVSDIKEITYTSGQDEDVTVDNNLMVKFMTKGENDLKMIVFDLLFNNRLVLNSQDYKLTDSINNLSNITVKVYQVDDNYLVAATTSKGGTYLILVKEDGTYERIHSSMLNVSLEKIEIVTDNNGSNYYLITLDEVLETGNTSQNTYTYYAIKN